MGVCACSQVLICLYACTNVCSRVQIYACTYVWSSEDNPRYRLPFDTAGSPIGTSPSKLNYLNCKLPGFRLFPPPISPSLRLQEHASSAQLFTRALGMKVRSLFLLGECFTDGVISLALEAFLNLNK